MLILTRDQMREADRLAMEELGIPGIVLMENAARQVAETTLDLLTDDLRLASTAARVVVVCGGGNNGGDGLAAARHLHNRGVGVAIFLAREPAELRGDAATNLSIVRKMGLDLTVLRGEPDLRAATPRWQATHVLIDALLGTGFTGAVRGLPARIIEECNRAHERGLRTVAVDLPSGLDCDTGQPSNATIRADVTVTFLAPKPGLLQPAASHYVGKLVVADIGAPPSLIQRVLAGRVSPCT